ncbi:hypothetical protein L873DRAFT_1796514, partial [Choiromyces venosus 120613-1]
LSIVISNLLNSKSEVFTNLFKYHKYLQILGINSNSEVFSNLLNSLSVVVNSKSCEYQSEVFADILNITANLLNMTANCLNSKSEIFTNPLEYNCKSFEYKPDVFTKIINSKSEEFTNILKKYKSEVLSVVATINLNIRSIEKSWEYKIFKKLVVTSNTLNMSVGTANLLNSKLEVFTNLFEYKTVVLSIATANLGNITVNIWNSKLEEFTNLSNITRSLLNITANLLNKSVVTENLLNRKPEIFMKILNKLVVTSNTLNSKLAVFTNIFEYTINSNCKPFEYKSKISRNILNMSIVIANLFNTVTTNLLNFKLEVFTNFLKISKQELFANLLNSKPVVESVVTAKLVNNKSMYLPIFLHIVVLHFLNIRNIYKSLQYNSEVFTNLLNTKSVIVSGVTINLLKIIENILNTTTNLLNLISSVSTNYKSFEYIYKYFEYNCKSFEYKSELSVRSVSGLTANLLNSTLEVFKNSLNISYY